MNKDSLVPFPARRLDGKGRCCGRKPLTYKSERKLFCTRCNADFNEDGTQRSNWMWRVDGETMFLAKEPAGFNMTAREWQHFFSLPAAMRGRWEFNLSMSKAWAARTSNDH